MKKIKRNQICPLCDSGKKYKKCCIGKVQTEEEIKRECDMIENSVTKLNEINPFKHFSFDKKVPTVRRVENLPTEVKSKVLQMLNDEKFRVRNCWFNSALIATEIEGVEKVDGWYGIKMFQRRLEEQLIEAEEKFGETLRYKKIVKKIGDRQWIVDDGIMDDGGLIYDFEKNIEYGRHSWNSYKGIHFDVDGQYSSTAQLGLNDGLDYRWIDYIEYGIDNSPYLSGANAQKTQSYVEGRLGNATTETLKAA